jgi:dTDP-4-amino-4,6-dideoxygalactose transaminase
MAAQGVHKITSDFEKAICDYTGAPYCVAVDNCSNAIFLALMYKGVGDKVVEIPSHTYPAVPCEIIHAGGRVSFLSSTPTLIGAYPLGDTDVWDSALEFNADMYLPGQMMCLSFTGPYKHLKLGKGGAILTDDEKAYRWFKKARFSARGECSYHDDDFDNNPVMGWNFYMMPEIAARGLLLIQQFYNLDGSKIKTADLSMKYPDLSKFNLWK